MKPATKAQRIALIWYADNEPAKWFGRDAPGRRLRSMLERRGWTKRIKLQGPYPFEAVLTESGRKEIT